MPAAGAHGCACRYSVQSGPSSERAPGRRPGDSAQLTPASVHRLGHSPSRQRISQVAPPVQLSSRQLPPRQSIRHCAPLLQRTRQSGEPAQSKSQRPSRPHSKLQLSLFPQPTEQVAWDGHISSQSPARSQSTRQLCSGVQLARQPRLTPQLARHAGRLLAQRFVHSSASQETSGSRALHHASSGTSAGSRTPASGSAGRAASSSGSGSGGSRPASRTPLPPSPRGAGRPPSFSGIPASSGSAGARVMPASRSAIAGPASLPCTRPSGRAASPTRVDSTGAASGGSSRS